MQETWIQSLGWEDPLEKGMTTHARIPRTEKPDRLQSMGRKESDKTERLNNNKYLLWGLFCRKQAVTDPAELFGQVWGFYYQGIVP